MNDKKPISYLIIIPITIGLVFVVLSVLSLLNNVIFWKNATESITGTITEITTSESYDSDTGHSTIHYAAHVLYAINGKEYTTQTACSYYESVGDEFLLHYNPDKPEDARGGGSRYSFSIISLLAGGIMISKAIKTIKKNSKQPSGNYNQSSGNYAKK